MGVPETGSRAAAVEKLVEAGKQEKAATRVQVVLPRRGMVRDSITLSDDLRAVDQVDINSRVTGVVTQVPLREGDWVEENGLILSLDTEELTLTCREQEYNHKDAVERAKNASLERTEAKHNKQIKKLAFDKAKKDYDRIAELLRSSVRNPLSEEEVDAKRFTMDETRLAHETALLAAERAEVLADLAKITVQRTKLNWDRALLDLSRAEIRSPIAGNISFLELRPGELVPPGTLVASVVNRNELYTEVRVPQRRLSSLRVGLPVEINAETHPDRTFTGRVEIIHPTVDPEEGTVKVRVSVEDPDSLLRPGTYLAVTVVLTVNENAMLVPKRARIFEGDESVIFVVRDGLAVRVPLALGLQTPDELQVLNDEAGEGSLVTAQLRDEDLIVVRGQSHVRDGGRVEIHDPNAKPESEASEKPEETSAEAQAEPAGASNQG